jgi:antiviral defense system Shedu protein SduA
VSPGNEQDLKSITRVQAQSGVGYSTEDVLVHQTSKSRIIFRPWYIPHKTQPHGLAGKLIRQTPSDSGWSDEETINLDENALGQLRSSLEEQSAVARTGEEGTLVLIRGSTATPGTDADADEIARAVASLFEQPDVLDRFAEQDLGLEILSALRHSIRFQELRRAVDDLRQLLQSGEADEASYQDWCLAHSWAFGNAYMPADDLRRVSRTDEVDILLPRVLTGYRDVVELKRPDETVLVKDKSRGTYSWSRGASQAIGQCHEYLDNLHEDASRGLRGRPEIVAYHPRATIVIGRSIGWPDETHRALAGLNRQLSSITLMTYDQLLAQGEELLKVFQAENNPG